MLALLPPTAKAVGLAARQVTACGHPSCSSVHETGTVAGAVPGSAMVACLGAPGTACFDASRPSVTRAGCGQRNQALLMATASCQAYGADAVMQDRALERLIAKHNLQHHRQRGWATQTGSHSASSLEQGLCGAWLWPNPCRTLGRWCTPGRGLPSARHGTEASHLQQAERTAAQAAQRMSPCLQQVARAAAVEQARCTSAAIALLSKSSLMLTGFAPWHGRQRSVTHYSIHALQERQGCTLACLHIMSASEHT